MAEIFDKYESVFLDSTFFVSEFSDEVKKELKRKKVYISDTFYSEIDEYRKVLSLKRKEIYDQNIQFLNQNISMESLSLHSYKPCIENIYDDMWGLILHLLKLNDKFIVISANQLLIEKIISNELKVDIFDLNTNMVFRCDLFFDLKSRFLFINGVSTEKFEKNRVCENSVFFCENGSAIILEKEMEYGLEMSLYYIKGTRDSIAKILRKGKLSVEKYNHIKKICEINKTLDIEWVSFPKDIIYYDSNCTVPVGFIVNYINTRENLDENPLFIGDLFNIPDGYLSGRISYLLDICLKIVRQICYLNACGFYVSDFNLSNFSFRKNNDDNIQMWDSDSFGYDNYFEKLFSKDYVDCINYSKYSIDAKEDVIERSNNALYQFIFFIISLGDPPISDSNKKFKYDNPDYFAVSRKSLFPLNIWNHMADVFHGNRNFCPEVLMKQLIKSKKQLTLNPDLDRTYEEILSEIIPEFKRMRKRLGKIQKINKSNTGNLSICKLGIIEKNWKRNRAYFLEGFLVFFIIGYLICTNTSFNVCYWIGNHRSVVSKLQNSLIKEYRENHEYKNDIKTIAFSAKKNLIDEDDSTKINLIVSRNDIVISKGTTITLTVTAIGNLPDSYYFSFGSSANVGSEWRDWIAYNAAEINLTGENTSEEYVTFYIVNGETGDYIEYTDVPIKIK